MSLRTTLLIAAVPLLLIAIGVIVMQAKPSATPQSKVSYKNSYLPLGDSYTIGQSVNADQRFPDQLVDRLSPSVTNLGIVANASVTGYTSQDLIDNELPLVSQTKPTFVTILIGVNDYVQGISSQTFAKNLRYIVTTAQQNMANPKNIVLITIPDYAKTPAGALYGNPATASQDIDTLNTIIKSVAADNDLPVVDIYPISQNVTSDSTLTADDGLHPSGKQYGLWVDALAPVVQAKVNFN